jgi:hypothetical protein
MADRYQYPDAAGARDHHGHQQRSAESDPLAELARLIGQTDPNVNVGRSRATPLAQPHFQEQDQYQDQPREPAETEPAPPSWIRAAGSWSHATPTVHSAAREQDHHSADERAQNDQGQNRQGLDDQDYQDHQGHGHQMQDYRGQNYQGQGHQDQDYQAQEYSDTPSFLRTARQHDQSRYDDVLYDQNSQNAQQQYADPQYQDGYQDQSDPNGYPQFYADAAQDEPTRRRGGLMTVLAVLVLAVVGTAAAYGYRSFTGTPRSGEPPIIKAEPGANKIVPPTQTSDASGKIVDRIGGAANGQERVLSREEQPIDINGRNAPRVVFPPLNQSSNQPALAAVTQTAPPAAQPAAPSGALSDEPKRVRTMTIRPEQPDTVPSGTPAPQRPATSARAQVPAPSANAPVSLSPQGGSAPVRTAAATATPNGSGGYMVQVSSQRSEADAQASYRAIQSKFPNVLGSRPASIRRADLGEKGIYYRAMVGPFAVAEEAGQLCSSLRSAGGQCVVQRN